MVRSQHITASAALLASLLAGCSTPLFDRDGSIENRSVQIVQPAEDVASVPSLDVSDSSDSSQTVAAREEAMAKMLEQLDSVRQMDTDAQQRLLTELRQKKTDEWPLLVSQFHASLKYRQQLDEEGSNLATNKESSQPIEKENHPPPISEKVVSVKNEPPEKQEVDVELAAELSPTQERDEQVITAEFTEEIEPALAIQPVSSEIHVSKPRPLPPVDESENDPLDWQQHIEAAINMLESKTETLELPVLQQVQQKLLQLVAGKSDDAMLPISGATPHEQRYWSEQFFALSTLTDSDSKLGDDRRAAQASQHLNAALTHLRDLSTLTVHRLAFCNQVFDFGAYEPHEDNRFTKNQEVTLYAEVENYSSELTDKGYHTWFASRYEVLDDQGRRIDGGNFPDVEDTCQNRRRDFHIQYALPLPEHAKPGKYKLQLTVEDRLNGREGTNVIEFDLIGP